MRLVGPGRGGDGLQRRGQRRTGVGAQLPDAADGLGPAGDEARPQARQVRAFRERVEGQHAFGVGADLVRYLEDAGRRGVAPDLGIAFVGEDAEIVLLGQRQQPAPVGPVGNRALRVGRRAEIGDGDAVEHGGVERGVVGQVPGLGGRRHVMRLGAHGERGHGIDLIERIGRQDHRALAVLPLGAEREGCVEQPFARAVERHQPVGRKRHAIAARDPAGDGVEQLGRAVVVRVAGKTGKRPVQHIGEEGRHRVARLADGHGDRGAARGVRIKKRPQTRERVVRQMREPLGIIHHCLFARGRRAPFTGHNSPIGRSGPAVAPPVRASSDGLWPLRSVFPAPGLRESLAPCPLSQPPSRRAPS
jgi:hypothetical protein